MLITAAASRASSLRSHWAWLPRPIGQPVTIVSTMPPERVAGLPRRVDRGDDRRVGLGVERVDRAGVADRRVERERRRGDPAELADIAEDRDPQLAQQQLGQRPDRDPQRRLAGAGAFEDLADAGLIVDRAGQVDVAAPGRGRLGSRSSLASLLISRSVIGPPVVTPWYDARIDDDPVGLERLPLAAAVASLAALRARGR